MSDGVAPGPEVGTDDDLYRCITTSAWWVAKENRPSTAALREPDFSTDMVSIAKTPAYTLNRFGPGCGLIQFNYGDAKQLGFVARAEVDPEFPGNTAHANVFNSAGTKKRKTMAFSLIELIVKKGGVVVAPTF